MSRLFGSPVLWHWSARIVLFWAVTAGLGYAAALTFPFSQPLLIRDVFAEAFHGNFERISDQAFAFALASLIVQAAAALCGAYLIAHVILIRLALSSARTVVRKARNFEAFAADYDRIDDRLRRHALVGHAWGEFAETLVREDATVRNTMRPQVFINVGSAREHLFGLKMIGSVPGFFVGLGLLLTFIGLAFALHEAASATGAKDSGMMLGALGKLLAAATFKFSTSIAGLGSSLVLSLAFRSYTIWIEGAFDGFCRDLERRLLFFPPQKIAAETNEIMAQSRDQLKEINSDRFFSRLGESVAPSVQSAMSNAVAPMAERLDAAMQQITQTSQSGLEEMLQKFQEGLQHGAGSELRELARNLNSMQGALADVQRNLSGSGEDFSRRLTESAEALNRLVAQAGEQLGGSANASRQMLEDVVGELRSAFESANQQISQTLATSASGAAGALEGAVTSMMGRLEAQTGVLSQVIGAMHEGIGQQAEGAARAAREAADSAAATSAKTARDVSEALMSSTRTSTEALERTLATISGRMESQASAFSQAFETMHRMASEQTEGATRAAREAADAAAAASARAAQEVSNSLASSTRSSTETLEKAMAGISARLETQAASFSHAIETMQRGSGEQIEAITRTMQESARASAAAAASAAQEAAETMRASIATMTAEMRASIEELSGSLRRAETAMAQQVRQAEATAVRSRETADAFAEVATSVRAASQPLLASSQTIASASDRMATTMESSVSALETSQQAAAGLAQALRDQVSEVQGIWAAYEQRFGKVDQEMEGAVVRFGEEVRKQQDATQAFVLEIDTHFKRAADNLQRSVDELSSTNEELADAILSVVRSRVPADA